MERKYPIGMWYGIPEEFLSDAEAMETRVREAAEAGFTMLELKYSLQKNLEMLKLCEKYGLRANVADRRMEAVLNAAEGWEETLRDIVRDYRDCPAMSDYMLRDEPTDDKFPNLARVVRAIRKLDSEHVPYINLLPNLAVGDTGADYERHVRNFVETVQPNLLSYDHYSLLKRQVDKLDELPEAVITPENRIANGWENLVFEKFNRPGFIANLEVMRRLAHEYGLPWMIIVMVVEHWQYRYLNEAELRWEVFQSLAYGPQRISYFTYWTPLSTGEAWTYHHALIAADGTREEHYDMVAAVNRDVAAIENALQGAQSVEVLHVGPEEDEVRPFRPFFGLDAIEAEMLTLGFFERDGERYVLLANKDMEEAQSLSIESKCRLLLLDRDSGTWEPVLSVNGIYFMEIAAGDGALIKILKKQPL